MYNYEVSFILGVMAAIILTILAYVFVMPKKNDGNFSHPALQKLHDVFNFKKLYLESILKFFYVLATIFCVCTGFFMIFGYREVWGYYDMEKASTALIGLLVMIGGPIVFRLTYESLMMFILLVKNAMEINNKIPAPKKEEKVEEIVAEEKIEAQLKKQKPYPMDAAFDFY